MSRVISTAVDGSVKKLSEIQKKADAFSRSAFDVGRSAGVLGLAVAAPLGMAVKAAAEFEQMNVSLKTAFQGNEAAAQKAFGMINKFAATTPYEMGEVMRGFIKLKNMGLDPSIEALTAYGNTASSMGKSLNDMVEAVADAATGEFERLKEFGIKAKTQGDMVSFIFQGTTTKVRKNSAEIEKYLKNIGLTKFAGGIDAQSKTFNGMLSTVKDQVKMFAASIGNILIPVLKDLFTRVQPVLDKIQAWTKANPELTRNIVMGAAAFVALSFAVSGVAFVFGGLAKAISMASTVFSILSKTVGFAMRAIQFLIPVLQAVTTFLLANPIVLVIMAIAVAALLIYKYWEPIKKFFIDLWEKTKQVFWKVVDWLKKWGILFLGPIGFIIKYWKQIASFFKDVWEKVKGHFLAFFDWLSGVPGRMFDAGVNIVKSIWEGIKSMAHKPIEEMKNMVTKIREFLPFSPAKVGPLRDIHRIRLIETIADTMKPAPLVKAMRVTTAAAMVAAVPMGSSAKSVSLASNRGNGGGVSVSYAPVITLGAGANTQDFAALLKRHEKEIVKVIEEATRKSNRAKF